MATLSETNVPSFPLPERVDRLQTNDNCLSTWTLSCPPAHYEMRLVRESGRTPLKAYNMCGVAVSPPPVQPLLPWPAVKGRDKHLFARQEAPAAAVRLLLRLPPRLYVSGYCPSKADPATKFLNRPRLKNPRKKGTVEAAPS